MSLRRLMYVGYRIGIRNMLILLQLQLHNVKKKRSSQLLVLTNATHYLLKK